MFSSKSVLNLTRDEAASVELRRKRAFVLGFVVFWAMLLFLSLEPNDGAHDDDEIDRDVQSFIQSACGHQLAMSTVAHDHHPYLGHELILRVRPTGDTVPSKEAATRCLHELSETRDTAALAVRPLTVEPAYIMVLVQPGSAEFNEKAETLLAEFLLARSRSERIGLFLWEGEIVQVADFSSSRSALLSALHRTMELTAPSDPLSLGAALSSARNTIARIAPHTIARRAIISVLGSASISS